MNDPIVTSISRLHGPGGVHDRDDVSLLDFRRPPQGPVALRPVIHRGPIGRGPQPGHDQERDDESEDRPHEWTSVKEEREVEIRLVLCDDNKDTGAIKVSFRKFAQSELGLALIRALRPGNPNLRENLTPPRFQPISWKADRVFDRNPRRLQSVRLGRGQSRGAQERHADHRTRRVRRADRSLGLGQKHADEHARLLGPPDERQLQAGRRGNRHDVARRAGRHPQPTDRLRLSEFQLAGRTTAVENVELPLLYSKGVSASERRRRAIEKLELVGLGNRLDHQPTQLSGDSSSAWPLPGRW